MELAATTKSGSQDIKHTHTHTHIYVLWASCLAGCLQVTNNEAYMAIKDSSIYTYIDEKVFKVQNSERKGGSKWREFSFVVLFHAIKTCLCYSSLREKLKTCIGRKAAMAYKL